MRIEDILALSKNTKVLITVGLDAGTKETFDVTLVSGIRSRELRPECVEWLKALNLEVKDISVCREDTCGNKDLLCIVCHQIKVMSKTPKEE